MVDFVRPGYLGSMLEFERLFKIPIIWVNALIHQLKADNWWKNEFCLKKVFWLIKAFATSFAYNVILVKMTELQKQFYEKYKTFSQYIINIFDVA